VFPLSIAGSGRELNQEKAFSINPFEHIERPNFDHRLKELLHPNAKTDAPLSNTDARAI
jgi:hypothetical protein